MLPKIALPSIDIQGDLVLVYLNEVEIWTQCVEDGGIPACVFGSSKVFVHHQ